MKLSELVHLRNQLEELSSNEVHEIVAQQLKPVMHLVETSAIKFPELEQDMNQGYRQVLTSLTQFGDVLQQIRDQIQSSINDMLPAYHAASYKLYEFGDITSDPDYVLNRRPQLAEKDLSLVRGRILVHSHWQKPGMILRPGLETWTRDMVALDPLYVCDINFDLLRPIIDNFPEEYQRRLRTCVVQESVGPPFLSKLPDQQLGFVLAYNFFTYRPLEIIKQYLEEIYHKLSPGGVLAMSINDCDRVGGVLLAERNFACYATCSMVASLARNMGYEIQYQYHLDAANTWLELVRPGTRTSLRGGQALSVINHRSLKK